jgi:hypothetical protein
MDRFMVMVDAGYFLRQSIEIVSHRASSVRKDLVITDPEQMIRMLVAKSRALLETPDRELLRVYWYDGVLPAGMTLQQRSISALPDVLFRAGTVNPSGQQRGVDPLIITDLMELTIHRGICDAVLITGDSDLAIGISMVQRQGIRIAVMGLEDLATGVAHNQSWKITSRADRLGRLDGTDLAGFMAFVPAPGIPSPDGSGSDAERIRSGVISFIASQADLSTAVDPATNSIEGDIDKQLIFHVYSNLGRKLAADEKALLRDYFKSELGFQATCGRPAAEAARGGPAPSASG